MLPPLPEALFREALRHKLLDFLCTEGVLAAGFALDFIAFPVQTAVGEVPEDVITSIDLLYGPILAILSLASI